MENLKKYLLPVLLLIGISFLIGRCTKECVTVPTKITVTTPEKKGSFEGTKILIPESTNIKTVFQYKDSIITIPQVNEELLQKYLLLEKENEKLKFYTDAISINTYTNDFENKDLKLKVKSKVQGKLLSLDVPEYTIKPQEITTNVDIPKSKEKIFSMNVGAGLNTNSRLDKLEPTANLDFTFKNGDIIGGSYGIDHTISVKYTKTLFSIKK